jgi:hypothetical protein
VDLLEKTLVSTRALHGQTLADLEKTTLALKRIEKLYREDPIAEQVYDEKRLSRARDEYNNAFYKLSLSMASLQRVVEGPVATGSAGEGRGGTDPTAPPFLIYFLA